MLNSKLIDYFKKLIVSEYSKPCDKEIELYRQYSNPVIIKNTELIKTVNVYYNQGISGTNHGYLILWNQKRYLSILTGKSVSLKNIKSHSYLNDF